MTVTIFENIRLNKTLILMINEGVNASGAAVKVGYEGASQFSSEFKRLFGNVSASVAVEMRKVFGNVDPLRPRAPTKILTPKTGPISDAWLR